MTRPLNGPKNHPLKSVTLADKYSLKSGQIYLSGVQALVRLPLMQRWRDQQAGLETAGFISGYRGSPLGIYDQMLWQARSFLKENDIIFQPGINEDLGATAVWGSQQVSLDASPRYQGVFGLWYGKGPGVDRSGDVLKHANMAGTSRYGGVLAVAGDDHSCKSSTLPHQSEFAFIDAGIPVLHPADIKEVLTFGLYGWALSRFAGCWVGLKALADNMDASASINVGAHDPVITLPKAHGTEVNLNIRWPDVPAEQEKRFYLQKLPAIQAFARANNFDRSISRTPESRFGIVTTGKAYFDVLQALKMLGLTLEEAKTLGIAIYKVGMVWPLEPEGIKRFSEGLKEILVVEEKRDLIEGQIKDILFHVSADRRPIVVGKKDETGAPLVSSLMDLKIFDVVRILRARLTPHFPNQGFQQARQPFLESYKTPLASRTPFYCSGCPHNVSTKVPEGSRAMAGIGCHYMATWIYDGTQTFAQMGGEGVPWIGQAPFTNTKHVFANLGDGTYFHSGTLAIRACVAAKTNITFKILYNDAVAMTGGQPVDGTLTVDQITRQVAAEGVQKIIVVSDDIEKYPIGTSFASGVKFYHRRDLDAVQKDCRETPGVSVIIYDQTCAAEKRRRRKRGLMPDPQKRIFINAAVCEGCGDCSRKSNCLSVMPKQTTFGVKREIDQSTCNKDFSCVDGFCPSFVSVIGGTLRRQKADLSLVDTCDLPVPMVPTLQEPYNIFVAGVGGTGIVTTAALMAMAAHMEGKGCSTVDMTGLAQKGGAVYSHVRIAARPEDITVKRIAPGEANLLFGADVVVAGSPDALEPLHRGRTYALINTKQSITADFVQSGGQRDVAYGAVEQRLKEVLGVGRIDLLNATDLAHALAGDTIATNIFMLGYVYQKGWLPLSAEALEATISLNGVKVQDNLHIFRWGRLAAHDYQKFLKLGLPHQAETVSEERSPQTLGETLDVYRKHLEAYQGQTLVQRYNRLLEDVIRKDTDGEQRFAKIVAQTYGTLLSYKDEYEVARLYSNGDFLKEIEKQFSNYKRLEFHLAPPLLSRVDESTGEPQKKTYGPWIMRAFKLLAMGKMLRGTWLDPFGYTHERRQERALITFYEDVVAELLSKLDSKIYDKACVIAQLPLEIKGFGPVKEKNRLRVLEKMNSLMAAL